jgi:DnaJ-class molecular chaperone
MAKKFRGRWVGDVWPFGHDTDRCTTCEGTGTPPGAKERLLRDYRGRLFSLDTEKCPTCSGRGRLIVPTKP